MGFDHDNGLNQLQSGSVLNWVLGYDDTGNILSIADLAIPGNSQTFTYDDLYRLDTASGAYGTEDFDYDANGNRSRYQNGIVDEPYGYQPQSNQLTSQNGWSFNRDAAGNRLDKLDGAGHGKLYHYGEHSRLDEVSDRAAQGDTVLATYIYDGRGQRVQKITQGGIGNTYYVYGLNGELLGEYDGTGLSSLPEYIYLNGVPVATVSVKEIVVIPPAQEVIIDNGDAGTSQNGQWQLKADPQMYGPDYLEAKKKASNIYTWTALPPGITYDVYAWWVQSNSYANDVEYTIGYGLGETATVLKNQKINGGQWNLLGTYNSGTGPYYVAVNAADGKTSADAIKLVYQPDPIITLEKTIGYIHADHLGTPRAMSDANQTVVWRWDSRPFGDSAPNEDPDGDGNTFTLSLRFPGQYYDQESGLHYNYYRTYDPATGRYIESDPIGLAAGFNTFSYSANSPLVFFDSLGLAISGEWNPPPRFNLRSWGIDRLEMTRPSADWWGFIRFIRVYGYVDGFVNVDVKCKETDDCSARTWEVHNKIDVFYQGFVDAGPNAISAAVGAVATPAAGIATAIVTAGGRALTGGLDFLQRANEEAGDIIATLYAKGPDAICIGSQ